MINSECMAIGKIREVEEEAIKRMNLVLSFKEIYY